MRTHFIKREGNPTLAVLALGWAAGPGIVEHIDIPGCDIAVLHDWLPENETAAIAGHMDAHAAGGAADGEKTVTETCPAEPFGGEETVLAVRALGLDGYKRTLLAGWSFGVWAAGRLFAGRRFTRAVAFNGTPMPVHDLYGIEPRRMAVTIRGLAAGGMEPFDRRAYGDSFEELRHRLSPRPLERNIRELEWLSANGAQFPSGDFRWDKAIIGLNDQIFPPENMLRYWRDGAQIPAEVLPLPHYPFADGNLVNDELFTG